MATSSLFSGWKFKPEWAKLANVTLVLCSSSPDRQPVRRESLLWELVDGVPLMPALKRVPLTPARWRYELYSASHLPYFNRKRKVTRCLPEDILALQPPGFQPTMSRFCCRKTSSNYDLYQTKPNLEKLNWRRFKLRPKLRAAVNRKRKSLAMGFMTLWRESDLEDPFILKSRSESFKPPSNVYRLSTARIGSHRSF